MPKPDLPDGTLIEARQPGAVYVTGAVQYFNWGARSPLDGWRRADAPVRKRKTPPKHGELPITAAPEQTTPVVPADGYKYGKDTVIVHETHYSYCVVVAQVNGTRIPLFGWTSAGMACCGMRELRSQATCYVQDSGELSYVWKNFNTDCKNFRLLVDEWHPDAIKRIIDTLTAQVLTGTGACLAVFNSINSNKTMNQRALYDFLLADPLKRCVALPPTRNAVHNSLLYPMMIYATFNLPDAYKHNPAFYNWGPENVQIKAPLLSKTGSSEYVSDSLKAT